MGGLVDFKVVDLLGDELDQFYVLSSGINGSFLNVFKQGLWFKEFANSILPNWTSNIWCLNNIGDNCKSPTAYLILIMVN